MIKVNNGLFQAAKAKYQAEIVECVATLEIYFTNAVAIGEHPDLLSMFEILIIISNNRINKKEIAVLSMPLEEDAEPVLSDHESDEEFEYS